MTAVGALLYYALGLFLLVLIFRFIMEWVFQLSRGYRPSGIMAMVLELTYTITDPPLKALRRVIPPLRFGGFAVDLAFLVLFLLVGVLQSVVVRL